MSLDTIVNILFYILTYGVFIYSAFLLTSYILIAIFSVFETRNYIHKNSFTDYRILASSVHAPSVSILAPAYNEGKTIVENVRSLLSIYYVNLEVIVINDGSKDNSLQQLIDAYDLEKIDFFVDYKIKTKEVRGVYKSRSPIHHKLIVIDKVNGGKADALNVGINISSNNYLVCIDVDCILEQDALLKMAKPFLEQTAEEKVIASGGVIRIANSCEVEDGRLVKVRMAEEYLPRMQILEYIRSFILGRMAWSRLNGLMLISGAFGAFDKEIAIKAGGYDHKTVGEDMELVVRMRRYMEERNEKYRVTYIPDPLCWTEAPATFEILGRQRNRWTRGTIETLKFHKIMFLNPRYGLLGMLSYPYWFFFEMCAPVVEFVGFIVFFVFASFGWLDWSFFLSYLLFIVCFGYLYSAFSIFMEIITYHQYKRSSDILKLMLTALTEPFYFHPFIVWSGIKGYIDYLRKKNIWGEMTRQGFARKTAPSPVLIATADASVAEQALTLVPEPISVPVTETGLKPASFYHRKIAPVLNKMPEFLFDSFRYYMGHILVLAFLFVLTRGIELLYDFMQHGQPKFVDKVILTGLAKDMAFLSKIALWWFLPFALMHFIHKKLAHTTFIVLSVLLLLIQVALSQYFVTTLVPLGADLWSYSVDDIKQTIGASGGIQFSAIAILALLFLVSLSALAYLPRKLQANEGIVVFFILALSMAGIRNVTEITSKMMPGQEYSNSLSLNKAYYFFSSSYDYFFPSPVEGDIYSSGYADFAAAPDAKRYPFMHVTDSSADVLSPFFHTGDSAPNIVILMVEGLGRAFSNQGAYLGNFTPFLDSLAGKSLYWENFLSTGGRTFAVLPSLLGSLPFAKTGFSELDTAMPAHFSLVNLLEYNHYSTSFYYGGNAEFDNMELFLRKTGITEVNDEKTFPTGYVKQPASSEGFSWGYGDKELFRRYFETKSNPQQPYASIILTVSTHNPFSINEQERYLQRFEQRMTELRYNNSKKSEYRNFKRQYASILYADDAVRDFMNQYRQRPDFANTVFVITGDHRMPEIPMSTRLDRYHVPLLIYSPLLRRTAKFSSVSTHFDIAPSLTGWLKRSYGMNMPDTISWTGRGLDTSSQFRNIHAYPLKQTKNGLNDFILGNYMISGSELFVIDSTMNLEPLQDMEKTLLLRSAFNKYKNKNDLFLKTMKLMPDSLIVKYTLPRQGLLREK